MEWYLTYTTLLQDLIILLAGLAMWPSILLSRKQPVAMLAWLLTVTFIPLAGPLFYLLFGLRSRLPGLPRKKERSDRAIRQQLYGERNRPRKLPGGEDGSAGGALAEWPASVRTSLAVIERIGQHPLTRGNRLRLLNGAEEKYEAMLTDIAAARRSIHLEYFKLGDDRFGNRLADLLREKSSLGVEVRMLLDGVGSIWLSRRYIARLREAGVHFEWFHPLNPFRRRWSLNIRNHRKIVVIDGRVGYLGGINLGDEYLGRDPGSGKWHDLSIRMEGPVVPSLQRVFAEDWHFSTGELLAGEEHFPEFSAEDGGGRPGSMACIVNSIPSDDLVTEMHQIYFSLLSTAGRRAWLVTPYFLPDESIQTALANLALGGVDVRVLITQRTSERVVGYASRSFFPPMLEAGVRIFLFRPEATLHAKALLIDDNPMIIGSANLDQRSFHINFETGALIYDQEFARRLEGFFLEKMEASREITLEDVRRRTWAVRTLESLARLAAPLF